MSVYLYIENGGFTVPEDFRHKWRNSPVCSVPSGVEVGYCVSVSMFLSFIVGGGRGDENPNIRKVYIA